MASLRYGARPRAERSDDRPPPARTELGTDTRMRREYAGVDRPSPSPELQRYQPAMDFVQPQRQHQDSTPGAPRSKILGSSGIPQAALTTRRPSAPGRDPSRPPLTHQDKSWGSGSRIFAGSAKPVSSGGAASRASPLLASRDGDRRVLRRKQSGTIQNTSVAAQQSNYSRSASHGTGSSASSSFVGPLVSLDSPGATHLDRGLIENPTEVQVAMRIDVPTPGAQTARIYPELDRYRDIKPPMVVEIPYPLSTHDLPPPTPLFSGTRSELSGYSGSPSTRFSGSPGPGPYSRDTTPTTSISSQSPGLVAPRRFAGPRGRQTSPAPPSHVGPSVKTPQLNTLTSSTTTASPSRTPARPPVSRRRTGSISSEVDAISADPLGLAAVREASASSSSNSTVRGGDRRKPGLAERKEDSTPEKEKRRPRLEAPPPSPPPRKSSQKFKKEGNRDEEPSPSRPARALAQPIMMASAPARPTPPAPTTSRTGRPTGQSQATVSTVAASQAVTSHFSPRGAPPTRPSRDGTPDLQSQLDIPLPVIHSNLSSTSLSERRQSIPLGPGSRNQSVSATSRQQLQPQAKLPLGGRQPTPAPVQPDGANSALAASVLTTTSSSSIPTTNVGARPSNGRRPSKSDSTGSRSPSPGVSTFRARFPLFGRRPKTAPSTDGSASATAGGTTVAALGKTDKPPRKGPAAGTGHEGYGRVGATHQRRRSGGVHSRGLVGTMSSQESLELSLTDDPFLQERINPVVISGGAIVENRNRAVQGAAGSDVLSLTESNHSLPSGYSRTGSDVSLSSRGDRTTLWPSSLPRGVTPTPSLGSRRPSDSSDSEALAMRSTLAFRRSTQKLKDGADQSGMRIPKPIMVHGPPSDVTSPAVTSCDTTLLSDDSILETAFAMVPGPGRPLPVRQATDASASTTASAPASTSTAATATPKKLTKRARSPRRWTFFGRSSSQPETVVKKADLAPPRPVAATVKIMQAVQAKPAAFYTMIDSSEQEDVDVLNVQDVLRDVNLLDAPSSQPQASSRLQSPILRERRPSTSARSVASIDATINRAPSRGPTTIESQDGYVSHEVLPPSADPPTTATPEPFPSTADPPSRVASPVANQQLAVPKVGGRPSRLPQVGRIPKVVSARPEQTSPKSFSRPFNRISVQMPPLSGVLDEESVAKGPSPPRSLTPEPSATDLPSLEGSTLAGGGDIIAGVSAGRLHHLSRELSSQLALASAAVGFEGREFLAFSPPRKGSECTSFSTTSTCSAGLYSYADATAVIPAPNAPLAEDEVWLEYDDLLVDDVGRKPPPSARSSQGAPFYLEGYAERLLAKQHMANPLESPTVAVHGPNVAAADPGAVEEREERDPVASSVYSTDVTSRLEDALETGAIPISPLIATSEFSSAHDDPAAGVEALRIDRTKVSASTDAGTVVAVTQRNSNSSVTSSGPQLARGQHRTSDASRASSQLSEDNSPLSQVNLRVGSMTVSKWLTFGHVLFSPAREELAQAVPVGSSLKRHSILVIDGLGNDDWSFYAAETYPAANFFNLSPRAPLPGDRYDGPDANSNSRTSMGSSLSSFPLSPPNHHQIQYRSHLDRFPFAPESFTTVVYRFPAAAPESHYRNIVSEARRVLKPGGFIELSILDLDLNNMGNRSRRAVRRLKERINTASPDTSLGSTADLLLRLLGRRGFADVKSCRVGVPVASTISSATASLASSSASASASSASARRHQKSSSRTKTKDNRSLAEMMRDESPVADESITKMVAKVGRWWFSRCYESAVAGGVATIWNDRSLLSECEEWHTSLKLMVCHARVPDDGRARVASI